MDDKYDKEHATRNRSSHRASHSAEYHMRYEQSVFFAITVLGTNGGNQEKDRNQPLMVDIWWTKGRTQTNWLGISLNL